MERLRQLMLSLGENLAAGFLEYPEGPLPLTYCRAYRRYYETCPLVWKKDAPLFPAGVTEDTTHAVCVCYAHQYRVNWDRLEEMSPEAAEGFRTFAEKFHYAGEWIHTTLGYKRLLAEGIDGYEARLRALPESDFRTGLLDLIEGIRTYHTRALAYLLENGAPRTLTDALARVPFSPATDAYEALVAINFVLSLDGWDNIGRLDSILAPYHKGEDLRPVLRCMMQSIQDNDRWSVTLGPDYNDVTRQVLEASVGMARPLIQLRTTKQMPRELWDLALKRILEGGGQPAFYNEEAIMRRFFRRIPSLPPEDAIEFAGGGCTETAFSGLTYSGGTDNNINVLKIFEEYLYEFLPRYTDFDTFYEGFMTRLHAEQDAQMREINAYYNERARTCFAPIKTLFVDDCIERETGWFQGGARYTFSVCSDSGIPNTIDSLLAVRDLVYEKKCYTPEEFLTLLRVEDPKFFAILRTCPAYGVGDECADALVYDLTSRFYARYLTGKLDLGLGYFPTVHQFRRHIYLGKCVGATPDGRRAASPEADSLAAVNGKATKGPTVMLTSAARYDQEHTYGMAVTNLSISRAYSPETVRALVEGYFALGGTQLQITAVDKKTLLEAREDPDRHPDLIVRVGGYSEYYRNLTPELRDAVAARTLFE